VQSRQGQLAALVGLIALVVIAGLASAQEVCVGDCNISGSVTIDELLIGVNIALGNEALARCTAFDINGDGSLGINELLSGVRSSVDGCRSPEATPTQTPAPTQTPTLTPEEFVAEAADFDCLRDWTRIRHFRITNALGHLQEALAVANGESPPPYPVGTIIQLVPPEAMVKRGAGFFPDAHDWEFFVLKATTAGTEIRKRGRDEVVNIGPPCFACHGAAPQTDFVCETDNGCVPLNLPQNLITALQEGDPRCPVSTPAAAH